MRGRSVDERGEEMIRVDTSRRGWAIADESQRVEVSTRELARIHENRRQFVIICIYGLCLYE